MERLGHGLARLKASPYFVNNRTPTKGKHELLKVHGTHRQHIHLAHGEREGAPVNRDAQQTPRRNHAVLGSFLAEVLKRCKRPLTQLYLIKNDEGVLGQDIVPAPHGK